MSSPMSDAPMLSFDVLNLRSVAKWERKQGREELAQVIEYACAEIARLTQELKEAREALKDAQMSAQSWKQAALTLPATGEGLVIVPACQWQMVPKEPTFEMIQAGVHHENMGDMAGRYRAMLAAAPLPPPPDDRT